MSPVEGVVGGARAGGSLEGEVLEVSVAVFSAFFDVLAALPPLSVLYHPAPLKCTAGGLSSFSVFLLPHLGHGGSSLLPKGRVNSKTCSHFLQAKSKVGMEGV